MRSRNENVEKGLFISRETFLASFSASYKFFTTRCIRFFSINFLILFFPEKRELLIILVVSPNRYFSYTFETVM